MSKTKKDRNITKNFPVAWFFYKGSHTHPVRRTVLVMEANKEYILGLEIREGATVRTRDEAPIKRYNRCDIARARQLDKRRLFRRQAIDKNSTTLLRTSLEVLAEHGA